MIKVSICICACNEEDNIGKLIKSLQDQIINQIIIDEIIVVSVSTDATNAIVETIADRDSRVKLIKEARRNGKASAVNQFINAARNDVCVMISADVIPNYDCIEKLCLPFKDSVVGMTGVRSIPTNNRNNIVGFAGYIQWEMAHKLSLENPKLGECVAFRRIEELVDPNKALDPHTAVDEAYMEYRLTKIGYELQYVNDAVVFNRSPENMKDLIIQRRRIHAGHLHLKKTTKYNVSTLSLRTKSRLALGIYWDYVRGTIWMPVIVMMELYCMILGLTDYYILKKNPYIWKMSKSTKKINNKEVSFVQKI